MYKLFLALFIITTASTYVHAQDDNSTFEKAPKEKTFSIGSSFLLKNSFDSLATTGISLEFDYAWKLSGYNKKPAAYISVPIGYTLFTLGDDKHFSLLYYGWTVRHEITKNKKIIPYFGYSLLLNQLRINGIEGSTMGHQTKFEFGGNYDLENKRKIHLSLMYSLYRFPKLGDKNTAIIHGVEFKIGFRF